MTLTVPWGVLGTNLTDLANSPHTNKQQKTKLICNTASCARWHINTTAETCANEHECTKPFQCDLQIACDSPPLVLHGVSVATCNVEASVRCDLTSVFECFE